MIEILEPTLGFISASLVALIALGFGVMLVFFSGSALLVFGQFLPFVRHPASAGLAAAIAAVLMVGLSLGAGFEPLWLLPAQQLAWTGIAYLFVRFAVLARLLRWVLGGGLLLAAAIWLSAFVFPSLEFAARMAVQVAAVVLLGAGLGLWPLVLMGMVEHARARPGRTALCQFELPTAPPAARLAL